MGKRKGGDKALYQRIGFAVYKLREREGLTALVLAQRAGVHQNMIYRVESGLGISVSGLCRLAAALRVGVDDLISFSLKVVSLPSVLAAREEKAAKVVCGTDRRLF